MAQTIIFLILAVIILGCGILAVTTKRIMHAATYLMFVLFGTAGLYFLMGYTFLASVQVMVYAGGVVVLYIFALMLTGRQDKKDNHSVSLAKKFAMRSRSVLVHHRVPQVCGEYAHRTLRADNFCQAYRTATLVV